MIETLGKISYLDCLRTPFESEHYMEISAKYDCTVYPHNPICHGYTDAKFFGQTGTTDYLQVKFWSMCKGKTFQTEQEKSKLFCCDRLMNSLINFTYETGRREVFMKHDGELYADPLQRQVLYTWADPHENKAAMYTSELAERITGLKIVNKTMGPLLRISGYAPGGYRAHHHDTMHNLHVATFMFYFSEVDKGGETPFINSGVNVVPRKGSAVFWYNLFTDGITDQSTFHGGCPVIMGEKWASIRWIMYDWQDQLQCDLKPETRFEILVNGKSKYK
ncbi:unnamed protein product [Allacma fusca]|uniref:Fe2OG dioxygenase domain-containing protein n=1 Tax=Allacma fusca TaxID=39272 RepID=A0A8J2K0J5_9HEXA|nr:unnamed protein product [Allacma fusca]